MQKKTFNKNLIYLIAFLFLVSCNTFPKDTQNACKIFDQNYLWYKYIKKSSKTYGAPTHIILAIVNKESGFKRYAKPPRKKLFKLPIGKRKSSSLGYSQSIKKSWEAFKSETNSPLALRTRFKDSVMFIGWYMKKTEKINKIPLNDAYRQYLNYYLGWGNYAKKVYKNDKNAILFAKKVQSQSKIYRKQLLECEENLKNKYIIF